MPKFNRLEWLIVLIVVSSLLWGANRVFREISEKSAECVEARESYRDLKALTEIYAKWDDELQVALSTPKINLPDRISELMSIRRDVRNFKTESYTGELAIKILTSSMDAFIKIFQDFIPAGGTKPYNLSEYLNLYVDSQERLAEELERYRVLREGCS